MAKMPMSGLKAVEFIEEGTFGTTPTGSNWSWIGLADKYDTPIKKDTESFKYLPDPDDATGLSKKRTQVVGGTLEGGISYYAQDFAFWKYVMGNASTLGNTLTSLSIAEVLEEPDGTKKFIVTKGNVVKSLKITLPVDGVAKCDGSLQRVDIADPTSVDPTGVGNWEDEDKSDALLWESITDMCMDANAVPTTAVGHIIGDVSLEVVNEVDFPKDVDETTWTKIAGVVLNSRDINLGLRLTYVDVNTTAAPKIHDIISNSTLQNLRFTLGDRIAIIKNLLFTEWNPAAAPEEYLGEELTPETDNADFILAYKMGYAYALDGPAGFTDETSYANDTTVNNMTLLPTEPAVGDMYYFGRADETFSTLQLNLGTQGEGVWTITWEYWDSVTEAWRTCEDIVDGTADGATGFTATAGWHDVTHTIQTGLVHAWGATAIDGTTAYWLRANVSAYTSKVTIPIGTQAWVYGEVSEVAT